MSEVSNEAAPPSDGHTLEPSIFSAKRLIGFLIACAVAVVGLVLVDRAVEVPRLQAVITSHLIKTHAAELQKALTKAGLLSDQKKTLRITRLHIQVASPRQIAELQKALREFLVEEPGGGLHEIWTKLTIVDGSLQLQSSIFPKPKELERETLKTTISLPSWTSLVPPLVAILLAIFFRHVLFALFAAIWAGAMIHFSLNPFVALYHTGRDYLWVRLTEAFSLQIIFFTVALIGTVHIASLSGGVQGLVDAIAKRARGVRSTLVATTLMGVALFFDDYANSIVVGNAARPLTDRQRISREKLSYIVDSTAAPIAGIALVSTWIGFEVNLLDGLKSHFVSVAQSGYEMFFQMLPYRFYCILALALVFLSSLMRRDFGPMLTAEVRSRRTGKLWRDGAKPLVDASISEITPKAGVPARWYNALVPVGGVILFIVVGIFILGRRANPAIPLVPWSLAVWRDVFIAAADDVGMVLAVSGVFGTVLAIAMVVGQRLLTFKEAATAWLRGVRSMWMAIAILVLAMSIRGVTDDLNTARYLVSLLGGVRLELLPLAVFALAAAVAFATGTSWGTMGILLPVALPLIAELRGEGVVMVLAASAVLDGAIFGDHCSPISDTTVLSSIASGCDHIDHVQSQLPYAILTMLVAALCGYVFVGFGGAAWLGYVLALASLAIVLALLGRNPDRLAEVK
ncbi:MAG: Na+/H+ antiporter NhaC family protein [Myxococcales bacterium]|nr:Na+/H+ antiporter NhaC family protein [Myxococcales bacterium]